MKKNNTWSSFPKISLAVIVAFASLAPISSFAATITPLKSVHVLTCKSGQYKNSSGKCISSPKKATSWPAGSTAKCSDGTYSFSQSRRGTCSRHGGVAVWR
ncbi:MAG: DUF3761 domain-containing protein [Actinobacteria bacterium]|nr:DUF3761 domain-containing protein [Actinomycetota bacterium]